MDKSGTRTNGVNSGSRTSNWNNYPWNSNWNIGLRAVSDDNLSRAGQLRLSVPTNAIPMVSHTTLLRRILYEVKVTSSSGISKDGLTYHMGKKYKNLIGDICSMPNLYRAFNKAAKGKRYTAGYLQFKQHAAANLKMLSVAMTDGSYRPSVPNVFFVNEPKRREISAPMFSDRVVQHALCNVIEPIFDKTFLPYNFACRKGKGTHAGIIHTQAMFRRLGKQGQVWSLKMDFSKYFASVDRSVLHTEIRRKIRCQRTLDMIELFHPAEGRGIPIGNLTSQLFANVYGNLWDRYLVHTLGIRNWVRYMDDTLILASTRHELTLIQRSLEKFIGLEMSLRFSKWSIQPAEAGVCFLGCRIWPTHKLLRRSSVISAKRKIKKYRATGDINALNKFLAAWKGHARWANTYNLR